MGCPWNMRVTSGIERILVVNRCRRRECPHLMTGRTNRFAWAQIACPLSVTQPAGPQEAMSDQLPAAAKRADRGLLTGGRRGMVGTVRERVARVCVVLVSSFLCAASSAQTASREPLRNPFRKAADNLPIAVRVLVLNYDPFIPSEGARRFMKAHSRRQLHLSPGTP